MWRLTKPSDIPVIQEGQPADMFGQINVGAIDLNQDLPNMGLTQGFDYEFDVSFLDGTPPSFLSSPNVIDSTASSLSPSDTQFGDSLTPSAAGVSSQSSTASPRTDASQASDGDAKICYGMVSQT